VENPVKPQKHKTRANQGLSIAKEFHPNSYNKKDEQKIKRPGQPPGQSYL
jgi:hypothetical protein